MVGDNERVLKPRYDLCSSVTESIDAGEKQKVVDYADGTVISNRYNGKNIIVL